MTPAVLARSSALHARVRSFVAGQGEDTFDGLACDLARHQIDACPPLARLSRARGVDPASLSRACDIPAAPTEAYRRARIAAHGPGDDARVFRTSGTTDAARGEHAFRTLATYDAVALAHGRAHLFPDAGEARFSVVRLVPDTQAAPDSSLSHMCALFAATFAARDVVVLGEHGVDVGEIERAIETARTEGARVVVLSTSFALVHLLDALAGRELPLPSGSRVMQTGGYKGKSREVRPDELRAQAAAAFGLDPRAIVSEYGMTELSSQAYEGTFRAWLGREGGAEPGVLLPPAWMRVVPVDPETLAPVPAGERGIARIEDLANVDSSVAVQTQDVVEVRGPGIVLHGRLPGATPRGCSLLTEELLGAS